MRSHTASSKNSRFHFRVPESPLSRRQQINITMCLYIYIFYVLQKIGLQVTKLLLT